MTELVNCLEPQQNRAGPAKTFCVGEGRKSKVEIVPQIGFSPDPRFCTCSERQVRRAAAQNVDRATEVRFGPFS